MIEKSKLQDLEQRIEEKKKEISALREERAAAGTPAEMVRLDKRIADASSTLFALERSKNAVTYMPPQPTDKQVLLSGLNKYIQAKNDRVQEISDSIQQVENELEQTETELEKAIDAGDADKVVFYSAKRDEVQQRLAYIRPMKAAAENKIPFPDGEILAEWKKICEQKRPDFMLLLERIGLLAEEYRAACDELMDMNNTLLNVRKEMGRIAERYGISVYFRPILTVGVNTELLKISKVDGMKPGFIMNGLNGKAL